MLRKKYPQVRIPYFLGVMILFFMLFYIIKVSMKSCWLKRFCPLEIPVEPLLFLFLAQQSTSGWDFLFPASSLNTWPNVSLYRWYEDYGPVHNNAQKQQNKERWKKLKKILKGQISVWIFVIH